MDMAGSAAATGPRVNDFSVRVATVNGTGSQSANVVLLRTLFRMGIMASGKNLFPSNIAGLPTWFTIRVSGDGWIGSRRDHELVVAFNRETVAEDVQAVAPGGLVYADDKLEVPERSDVTVHRVPFTAIVREACAEARLRKLVANMAYVGVLAQQLGLDMEDVEAAIGAQFENKPKAVELNLATARAAAEWASGNLPRQDVFRVERGNSTEGKILIEGNRAGAYGAVFGGVQVVAWYPITPSSSLAEALIDQLGELRIDPETGKATYAVIQAEDELAALGMVIGAGWAGARAMTATSGPGISLMAEFSGLAHFTETPAVVVDVQRMGPSTGLPTRTSQGDVLSLALLSHGDTMYPVLFPAGPDEYFSMVAEALDLAARLQTLVFVAADLDLGMNWWIGEPFAYPDKPIDHGKVLDAKDIEKLTEWGRYRDVDGDGIPYRTLPGTPDPRAAVFTRGSGHDEDAHYSEDADNNIRVLERLRRKLLGNVDLLPASVVEGRHGEKVGVIAYGTSHWATAEARDILAREGLAMSYLRVRSWPFDQQVLDFVAGHDRVYVVEQNRDGQLAQLLAVAAPEHAARLRSVAYCGGLPLPVEVVVEGIREREREV
ncbi:MAG: 2-oxoacid:acceptor oxidoreductase subunit alpha [Acidobacteria bacterium]|jgi:2-oxoglutarate/2-oxoacid ferredoxin oxidoreductase subunit alpha|nr:2-oxoacid:acceptor oxidoreductase subunit alpha [Acidobacteriota bacterium]